jgi:DNA-binding Lrp family transcriptional regulator|tara:strand:- start:31 stop:498 length:468 start_codon:yes stop_codon:yes gene_type:complete
MAKITENTKDLVTNCIIRRLSTREALGYLKRCKVNVSERTYRRYKKEILKQQNMLESYAWNNVQIEQVRKIETKKSILHHCWDLFEKAEKITEKLSLLKTIEKISDELPKIVWYANTYGSMIEDIEQRRKEEKEKEEREKAYLENLGEEPDEDES